MFMVGHLMLGQPLLNFSKHYVINTICIKTVTETNIGPYPHFQITAKIW